MSLQLLPEVFGADRTADFVRERPKLLNLILLVLPVRALRIISGHAVEVTPVDSCLALFLGGLLLLITLLRILLIISLRPLRGIIDLTVV